MFFIVAEWKDVLKDTPGMNNDDDTRTDESTRGSIYNTFLACVSYRKTMELSPFLFREHFTNEQTSE